MGVVCNPGLKIAFVSNLVQSKILRTMVSREEDSYILEEVQSLLEKGALVLSQVSCPDPTCFY